LKVLRFWGIGEPLLNRDIEHMIGEGGPLAERTELATNGSLLARHALQIVRSGLQYIRISVYSTSNIGYELESGSRFKLSDIMDGVRQLVSRRMTAGSETPRITANFVTTHAEEVPLFRQQWEGLADDTRVEIMHNWGGTDSRLVQIASPLTESREVCSKPFYELVIKANGDVTPCCADWDGSLKVGNVLEQSLLEIWSGEKMQGIRRLHLQGRRADLSMCRECTLIKSQPDNLDSLVQAAC
jgi:radical SAM protein with 4Fe4S-binding SPASM domain